MTFIDVTAKCPRCETHWTRQVLQIDHDGREHVDCHVCRAPFFRVGGGCRFESPDNRRVFLPELTAAAKV